MRGQLKNRTFGFMGLTLQAIAAAAAKAGEIDRDALAMLADATEKAAQWNRDMRSLTRQDGTGIARQLTSKLARAAPITPLQEAMLLQGMATEQYLLCDYRRATDLANRAYGLVRPQG